MTCVFIMLFFLVDRLSEVNSGKFDYFNTDFKPIRDEEEAGNYTRFFEEMQSYITLIPKNLSVLRNHHETH